MSRLKTLATAICLSALVAGPAHADVAPSKDSKCSSGDGAEGALWLGSLVVAAYARRKRRPEDR